MTRPVLVWIALSLIWGSTWMVIKVGLGEGLPPLTFAGLRFLVGLPPLVALLAWRRPARASRGDAWLMVWTGVLTFGATYGLVFWAEQHISSGMAALLFATFPIFGMLLAHFMLTDERLTAAGLGGTALGVAGVGMLVSGQLAVQGLAGGLGSLAVLAAAVAAAYSDVLIKQRGTHIDPALMTTVQLAVGTLMLLGLGVLVEGDPRGLSLSGRAVAAILYLGLVGSALAFVLLYWLIRHMAVTRTMLLTLVTPLVAVLLGATLLGESLSVPEVAGGLLVLLGLWVTVRG